MKSIRRHLIDAVYPRVGGGASASAIAARSGDGLSPRGRGSPRTPLGDQRILGSIPAWAGEPVWSSHASCRARVYPRVGGGAQPSTILSVIREGLSPRGRGSRQARQSANRKHRSIPAWAGEPGIVSAKMVASSGRPRSIPAWAGEPLWENWSRGGDKVYPRVGGGASSRARPGSNKTGLSPRGRGSLRSGGQARHQSRSIPAWAGEPRPARPSRVTRGLSPRGRGSPKEPLKRIQRTRSIPAWAGEPDNGIRRRERLGVYPRVGGGARFRRLGRWMCNGLSPRGRGSRGAAAERGVHGGSIPAWAGEPRCCSACCSTIQVYPRVGGGA